VLAVLEAAGFKASKIPRGKTPTADFRVSDGRHVYLVEATHRSPAEYERFLQRLDDEGVAHMSRPLTFNNRLDGIVRKKTDQLAATPVECDFQIAWLTAEDGDSEHILDTLFRTLYGFARLMGAASCDYDAEYSPYDCFYYDHFTFFDTPRLNGVAYSTTDSVCLFLNAYAENAQPFRQSLLVGAFRDRDGLIDPQEDDAQPGTLFVDREVDRTAKKARWEFLRDKYGLYTTAGSPMSFTGGVRIPRELA
jgi:hypothetical protein